MTQGISSLGSDSQLLQAAGDVKTAMSVKLFQESQKSAQIAGSIIQDTVEISAEAMRLCLAERKQ